MRRWITATAIAMSLGMVVGCADASTQAPPASASPTLAADPHNSWDVSALPNPCRTLTAAEAATVIGVAVKPGIRLESWPPLCQFLINEEHREYLYLSDDSGPTGREDFERKRADSSKTQVIEGIGDQAYWLPEYGALHVLNGDTHVAIAFAGPAPPPDPTAKALALARFILPRTTA